MSGNAREVARGAVPISEAWEEEHNAIVDDLERIAGDRLVEGRPQLAVDNVTATAVEMYGAVRYRIAGHEYHAVPTAGITLPGTDDVTASTWGAWRFEIDALGAITATPAVAITSDQAFTSEERALLALAATARTASTIELGYLTLDAATGGFTVGTDSPVATHAAVDAANYIDRLAPSGLIAAATLAVGATAEEVSIGASTIRRNGVKLAEISAVAGFTFPLADTIAASKFGGFLFVTSLAGTGYTCVAADGDTNAVTAMSYNTAQAVHDALDALEAAMPNQFVVIGRLVIQNNSTLWTAGTDDLTDASDVTEAIFTAKTAIPTGGDLRAGKINP